MLIKHFVHIEDSEPVTVRHCVPSEKVMQHILR